MNSLRKNKTSDISNFENLYKTFAFRFVIVGIHFQLIRFLDQQS